MTPPVPLTAGELSPLLNALPALPAPALVGIDGRCGAGKSALAARLGAALGCPVFHMDHFFLPPALRTPARLARPGGNVHYERVLEQVILPFLAGAGVTYAPFDCHAGALAQPLTFPPAPLGIVEGSYALHPALAGHYARTLFLTCSPAQQRRRLLTREGAERAEVFFRRWIPLEEAYFSALGLPEGCTWVLDTTGV